MSGLGGGAATCIFISYSSKDTDIVNRLKAALRVRAAIDTVSSSVVVERMLGSL